MRGATCVKQNEAGRTGHFNPRTPCGVRPAPAGKWEEVTLDFNPRTPCGVRRDMTGRLEKPIDFNPRTPCGVRRDHRRLRHMPADISIHAPHAGCDNNRWPIEPRDKGFQSTHPMRGATLPTF